MSGTWTRPFVDRDVGAADAATAAARAAATAWNLPPPEQLRIGMNALFAAGDVVVRVGRPSADAATSFALARWLDRSGVRVAMPAVDRVLEHDGLTVTAWERLAAVDRPVDWSRVGEMIAVLHGLPLAGVPVGYPLPRCSTFPWWRFDDLFAEVGALADDEARDGLSTAIERGRGWDAPTSPVVVCHGDVQPGNVIETADGPVILDWDLLCTGPAAWDHAPMMSLAARWGGSPGWYPAFAAGYGRSMVDDPVARRLAELRLVAATLMRLRAGRDDPSAMSEAQRRLAYWRGDPDPPVWTAV